MNCCGITGGWVVTLRRDVFQRVVVLSNAVNVTVYHKVYSAVTTRISPVRMGETWRSILDGLRGVEV
jgi:hypothetical protein